MSCSPSLLLSEFGALSDVLLEGIHRSFELEARLGERPCSGHPPLDTVCLDGSIGRDLRFIPAEGQEEAETESDRQQNPDDDGQDHAPSSLTTEIISSDPQVIV